MLICFMHKNKLNHVVMIVIMMMIIIMIAPLVVVLEASLDELDVFVTNISQQISSLDDVKTFSSFSL